jgi:hypothetical protein
MGNKTKTITLIFILCTALFAGTELWGPINVVGDSAEAAVLRLGHTPAAALQPDSILVKLPDSTIGTYPLSAAMSDSVPWDFITDKPDSFQSKNHNHPISDVNNLIDSLNKKYNTADTNKLQQKITGAATTVTSNNLTVSSALISNSSGKIAVSPVTSAELGYLDGVTSNIQTQIGSKSDTSHNHALSDVTGLNGALSGKEPTITGSTEGKFWNGLKQWVNITIGHVLGLNDTITNHRTAIASKLNISDTSSLARKNHGHSQSQITGLVDTVTAHRNAINNKQPLDTDLTTIAGLTHSNRHVMVSNGSSWTRRALAEDDLPSLSISKTTGLQSVLDDKASLSHTHTSLRVPDTRYDTTTTGDYPRALKVNFKRNSTIGLSGGGTYSTVLGVFGWNDASGGAAHELAFGSNGIYSRFGIPGNDWGSFRRILTTADNPSSIGAEPAITGTANKVLSIQAGGTGVKTGSIYDNGNVALIGKATATGGYKLEVEGNTLVNGNSYFSGSIVGSSPAGHYFYNDSDSKTTLICGGGSYRSTSGATIVLRGNEYAPAPGDLELIAGATANGHISLEGNRVVMSRRNVGSATTINITTNPQIIDLNSYPGVSRFDIVTSRTDDPRVYFKNATNGDELFVKIVSAGQYPSEYDVLFGWNLGSDGTWMHYGTKRYFHIICEGTATQGGITANIWWMMGAHGLYGP